MLPLELAYKNSYGDYTKMARVYQKMQMILLQGMLIYHHSCTLSKESADCQKISANLFDADLKKVQDTFNHILQKCKINAVENVNHERKNAT